jgi:Transglycosylase-like domain
MAGAIGAGLVAAVFLAAAPAVAAPGADDWMRLRVCESGNNYRTDTGNGFYGAYQFTAGTWHAYGGTGLPSAAAPVEQDRIALLLYQTRGWRPWPSCSRRLGLRDDRRGRSDVGAAMVVPRSRPPAEHVSRSAHRRAIVPGPARRRYAVPPAPHRRAPAVASTSGKVSTRPVPAWPAVPTWSAGDSGRWGRAAGGPATTALQNAGWPTARWVGAWLAAARLAGRSGPLPASAGRPMRPQ